MNYSKILTCLAGLLLVCAAGCSTYVFNGDYYTSTKDAMKSVDNFYSQELQGVQPCTPIVNSLAICQESGISTAWTRKYKDLRPLSSSQKKFYDSVGKEYIKTIYKAMKDSKLCNKVAFFEGECSAGEFQYSISSDGYYFCIKNLRTEDEYIIEASPESNINNVIRAIKDNLNKDINTVEFRKVLKEYNKNIYY